MSPVMLRLTLCLFLIVSAAACSTKDYGKATAQFQASTSTSAAALAKYFRDVNEVERDSYLLSRVYDPSKKIEIYEWDAKTKQKLPTPLLYSHFSNESIQSRVDALNLIGLYGERLVALAGSTAPSQFAAKSANLSEPFQGLVGRFKEASAQQKSEGVAVSNADTEAYIGEITTLVGLVGKTVLEHKRDEALKRHIESGHGAVAKLLDLLEKDVRSVLVDRAMLTGTSDAISVAIFYNKNRGPGQELAALEKRKKFMEDYKAVLLRYDEAKAGAPLVLLMSMREANDALLKFAQSDGSPKNFAELMQSMENYRAIVEKFIAVVLKLAGSTL